MSLNAFGNLLSSKEDIHNRITYTGQQYDRVTNQYYLRARYYNPVIGRFTQEDVYRGDGLNLYAYCNNNPVEYCDPSGYAKKICKDGGPKENNHGSEEIGKAEISIGKKDLDALRKKWNVPETNTVAVGKTDIP